MRGSCCGVTYTLGRSLYIALTCRNNATTLPETRGPNFTLPRRVLLSLQTLRNQEMKKDDQPSRLLHRRSSRDDDDTSIIRDQQVQVDKFLPPLPKVVTLKGNDDEDLIHQFALEILQSLCVQPIESVVFAGEGEPTFKLPVLLSISRAIRDNHRTKDLPIRVVTNGLIISNCNKNQIGMLHNESLRQMKDSGITCLSIALMTSCPKQYRDLMNPISFPTCISNNEEYCPHESLCRLIQSAVAYGFNVEVTGVDRPEIDKVKAEKLALQLGVPFRWRSYFP